MLDSLCRVLSALLLLGIDTEELRVSGLLHSEIYATLGEARKESIQTMLLLSSAIDQKTLDLEGLLDWIQVSTTMKSPD